VTYIPSMKKLFYWRGAADDAWLYDPQANTWSHLAPKGPPPPFGIDASACLDLKRERIYIGGGYYPLSIGSHAFWCYDLKTNAWLDLQPKGKPCGGDNRYGPNQAVMNYDSVNDVVVLIFHTDDQVPVGSNKGRGIYVYDPAKNSWSETAQAIPKEFTLCANSFYSAELNGHFIHVAGDSEDNGVMWVYRFKPAKK